MDSTIKRTIGVILTAIIVIVGIYGSYLPMRKAQIFISTLQGLQAQPVSSLDELKARLLVPLDYPSPIGQEELVRNMANSVLAFVQHGNDPASIAALVSFLNDEYGPILSRGKGMSFGQDVYLMGAVNEIAFGQTGDPKYLMAAQQYYLEGNALGPDRPQPLYGLFDVYRAMGDATDTQIIASKILMNWPSDKNIPLALTSFLEMVQKKATSTKTK